MKSYRCLVVALSCCCIIVVAAAVAVAFVVANSVAVGIAIGISHLVAQIRAAPTHHAHIIPAVEHVRVKVACYELRRAHAHATQRQLRLARKGADSVRESHARALCARPEVCLAALELCVRARAPA